MKINNSPQYETIKLISQKPQNHGAKPTEVENQENKQMAQKPYTDLKTLNSQVAQVQELQQYLGQAQKNHSQLLLSLESEKSPEIEKKIRSLELKISEMLKKSLSQNQELEILPSLYRTLLQSYKNKDHYKIESLLTQAQNKLHYLLEKFEDKISSTFPQGAIEFDPKKIKNNLFAQSHNPSKLSLECLL